MKTLLLIGIITALVLASCEKSSFNGDYNVLFKTQSGLILKYTDFELYDSSTRIFYLKANHPELKTESKDKFSILAEGQEIYQGPILPRYSSYIPDGPFIFSMPSLYQDYAFKIECWLLNDNGDLRNDPRIIEALKKHGLLHSGLKLSLDPVEIDGNQLRFNFTLTNYDTSDLLIIDIGKTGPNLFHYFTNGLNIYNSDNKLVFKSNIKHSAPSSFMDWTINWLSVIKSGESRQFSINYTLDSQIIPGQYRITFEFPGLAFQISKDQLYQNRNRIWLGDIRINRTIVIN